MDTVIGILYRVGMTLFILIGLTLLVNPTGQPTRSAEAATQSCVGCHTATNPDVAPCESCHASSRIGRNLGSVCKGCHTKATSISRISWKSDITVAEW